MDDELLRALEERYKDDLPLYPITDAGIKLEVYDYLMHKQGGMCGICGCSPNNRRNKGPRHARGSFCWDHDHYTGKVRGLLCYSCNMGLGKFNDSIVLMEKAIKYLASIHLMTAEDFEEVTPSEGQKVDPPAVATP